jgi:2-methylcitrate dehydratase PrpD
MALRTTERRQVDTTIAGESPPIALDLAHFATSLSFADIPAIVVERAKLHILDALGIALAASQYDFAQRTLHTLRALSTTGEVPVIGMRTALPLRDAVLMNGSLVHGLDFDDTHSGSIVHVSASALPTALGMGMARRSSGADVIRGYLLAVEIDARLGSAVRGDFHQVGLHPTGLLGAFGCTLAAGRLAGLDTKQLVDAQGIVLSMAAGSLEFLEEGAWTKRIHPGWAGVCGITAAALAQGGFHGPQRAYEGRFGLYRMHLGQDAVIDWSACTAELGTRWEMLEVALKPYPACHFNHAFADATLALVRQHGLSATDVDAIIARIASGEITTVCEPEDKKRHPANSYDAQFSLHYVIAATLVRKQFTLAELETECVTDPEILALCQRVRYEVDPSSDFPQHYSGEVIVSTRDGRVLSQREQINRGAAPRPLTRDEVVEKYFSNASRALSLQRAQALLDLVMTMEQLSDINALKEPLSAS